jgi:hypothetical protein
MVKRFNRLLVKDQNGQVLVALVLTLLTILTIGLIIIQRSTTDITTSTQNDQASRAFSAAEAGIEQALQGSTPNSYSNDLTNSASYVVTPSARLPQLRQALEYPPTGKGEIAQFWLADPSTLNPFYTKSALFLYFGNSDASGDNLPAIEVTLITRNTNTNEYLASRRYVETNPARAVNTNFESCTNTDPNLLINPLPINTSSTSDRTNIADRRFKCRVRINTFYSNNIVPIMVRTRVLYSDNQPVALAPIPESPLTGDKSDGNSLPDQATIYTSIGVSGQSRRTIQAFKLDNVVPFFFDYAIFSVGDLVKTN